MTELPNGSPNRLIDLLRSLPMAWRLFWDKRTPLWTKGIPILTLGYLIWPLDLLADPILGLGQLDDLAVVLLGLRLFVYTVDRVQQNHGHSELEEQEDVVDAEFHVMDEK